MDDKEFEGNLIFLKQSSQDFIKNNSKVRFVKEAQYTVDKPDYAERSVTEAVVNALIHRQYINPGSEIHIDMYDDRIEITSPGGMIEGVDIQNCDIYNIESRRRNPIIADLFHRMHYMERRGSGLRDIVGYTQKLPNYTSNKKPEFLSDHASFKVILWNVNYTAQDTAQDLHGRTQAILRFCTQERSRDEIMEFIGVTHREYFRKKILNPLIKTGKLLRTIPDKPTSKHQKYITSSNWKTMDEVYTFQKD